MEPRAFPPWMSLDPMFQISAQSVEAIQSYWSASAGYRNWVLIVVRANDLKCSLMFWINYMVNLEFPLNKLFGDSWVFNIFHSIQVGRVRKTILSMKTQTSHLFSQLKSLFINFKTFYFIELHETHSFTLDCKDTFSPECHEIHLRIEWNMFLHDHAWNLIIWSHVHFFSFSSNFHRLHMILVVHPVFQVCDFKNLLNSYSHEKWKSSRKILKFHNQASINISSLLIFKLSSCDPSPSLITSKCSIFESW